jgi:hypothetical protein
VVLLISVFVVTGSYGFEYMDDDWKLMMMDSTLRYYWILFDGYLFGSSMMVYVFTSLCMFMLLC